MEEYLEKINQLQDILPFDANLSKVRNVLDRKEFYEQNIEEDLGSLPDILCPILSLDERLQKLSDFGVSKEDLDKCESEEINKIRESRKVCGCSCKEMNMVCGENGDLCDCFANGINCQLDRIKFPCGCSVKRCKNLFGLKRFNPKSVIDHYKEKLYSIENKESKKELLATSKSRKRKSKQTASMAKRKKLNVLEANSESDKINQETNQ